MKPLTTTSYVILSWLAVRPWSTYELAKQMRRNLRFFWPRAASWLYEEPKSLVEHGLATAERGAAGRRPKTIYAITAQGRKALQDWMSQPVAAPSLAFEGLVRIFFADFGSAGDLARALDSARHWAAEIQNAGTAVAHEYLGGQAPFPERTHLSALVFDFLWNYAELLRDWADRTAEMADRLYDGDTELRRKAALEVFQPAVGRDWPRAD